MRLISIRCPICEHWHSPKRSCPTCGAIRVIMPNHRRECYNHKGKLMVRGIPMAWTKMVNVTH